MKVQPRHQPGDKIGGRYQVHQALMGGMGEIYLCLDLETVQPYALKTFQQRFLTNPKLYAAFEKEVAIWVALEKHPNIVRCFMMKILDKQPFMVLEWIAGEPGRGPDLRGWLRRSPLDLRQALDFAIDICRGLVHAQEKQPGLVHRDLKPENILIAQGGLAKVTDFGLAEIIEEAGLGLDAAAVETDGRQSIVSRKGIAGTPAYMAPEQWRGESLDERTDIYALGCILYEMLTGEWPFQVDFAPTTPQRFQQWLSAMQARHESTGVPALPASLPAAPGDLLERCLAKARAERPASLNELLSQLESLCRRQFATAPRATPPVEQFTAADYNNRGATYINLSRHDEALRDLSQAIELDPNDALAYSNRGLTHHGLQQYEAALADYNRAIRLAPGYAPAYYNRGNTYHALQRYDDALIDYSRAIQIDSSFSPSYTNRGSIYADLQRYEEALPDLNQAVQLDPNNVVALYIRGGTYRRLQRYEEALIDYGRVIQIDHTHIGAYIDRGNIYDLLQRNREALADYNRAIQLDSNCAAAYSNRGGIYANLRQYEEALTDLNRAIQLDCTHAMAYVNRGVTYAALQRHDEALVDYNRTVQLDPSEPLGYLNRGVTYATLQRYNEAYADFERTIQLDPTETRAYVNIGALLGNLGKYRDALPYFEKAAELGHPQGAQYAAMARQALGMKVAERQNASQQSKQQPGLLSRLFKKRK